MIVVANTTPLIGLASIGRFEFLHELFGEVYIARAVYDEAIVRGREHGGAKEDILIAEWLNVTTVKDRLAVSVLLDELDSGEAETIILASELAADWVLMDEKKGRRKLFQLQIRTVGTAGILLRSKQVGLLTDLRPELNLLRERGFSISQSVIETILAEAGE